MNTYPTTERLSADRSTRVIGATVLAARSSSCEASLTVCIFSWPPPSRCWPWYWHPGTRCFWVAVIFGFVLKNLSRSAGTYWVRVSYSS